MESFQCCHYSHYEYYNTTFIENTNKIIIPISYFYKLSELYDNVNYFFLKLSKNNKFIYSTVITFSDDNKVYLPNTIIKYLELSNTDTIHIELQTSLPKITFCKIQPQSVDFLEISNSKFVLEESFKNYSSIFVNQIIKIYENTKEYLVKIIELNDNHPYGDIIDVDLSIDFLPPVGYIPPQPKNNHFSFKKSIPEKQPNVEKPKFVAFSGKGYSLKD